MDTIENDVPSFGGEQGFDLKCDFPARESFRESLLVRLQAMNAEGISTDNDAFVEDDSSYARALTDDDLEMLAAAEGEPSSPRFDTESTSVNPHR